MVMRLLAEKFPAWRPAHYRDVVLASDPGLMRLRLAIRTSGTAALSALVLSAIAARVGQPSTATIIGAAIAMLGTVVLSDATLAQEKVTLALMPVVAGVTVVLGTVAAPNAWVSTATFCAVIFAAVYVRRYGPRATALGLIAFMGYFFSLYFNGGVRSIPWDEGALVVATAIAYLVRFGLVRERPQQVLEQTLRAFEARARVIFDDLAVLADSSNATRRRRLSRRIQRATLRLNETALALEDQVGASHIGAAPDAVSSWVGLIFDRELAVETLADAVRELSGTRASAADRRDLVLLARTLRRIGDGARPDLATAVRHLAAVCDRREPPHDGTCHIAMRAICTFATLDPWPTPAATGDRAPSLLGAGGAPIPPTTPDESDVLSPTIRLAIQATVAGALSIVAGRLISPERWFWAVITAFLVFLRATTLDETLSRAWQRTLGTVGGVIGGLIVAQLVGRDPHLALTLVFVGLFGAYYFFRVSYAWAIGFITTVLALLYTVLGRYSEQLLFMRLAETLAGAAVGTAVSAFVFPSHSRVKLRMLTGDLIRKAATCITDATSATTLASDAPEEERTLSARSRIANARETDRALQTLWNAAMPLMGRNTPVTASPVTRSAHNASALVFALRQLTSSTSGDVPVVDAPFIDDAGRQLAGACITVADALRDGRRPVMHTPHDLLHRLRREEARVSEAARGEPARWLGRIDRIVTDLVHTTAGSAATRASRTSGHAVSGGY
jgi:uncharacterized membrane protein YccC